MSKQHKTTTKTKTITGFSAESTAAGVEEYILKSNNLRVLYCHRPDTETISTNITYRVGAIDEDRGETGLAHMLEHMLFKPTTADKAAKIPEGGVMRFEREVGCILNANTWKDRTTYFFNYPQTHFDRAVRLEAERMNGVVLTPAVFKPEQGNVLSEFDMYNGDPDFALCVQMVGLAFQSHSYGHETIGYREDIEAYTAEKLERFYRNYYRPDNATLMVVGDIDRETALETVKKHFGTVKNPDTPIPRQTAVEPKQEGIRRVEIKRESSTNLVNIGFKHAPLRSKEWHATNILLRVLASGPESLLHKALIDTGKAADIDTLLEPTRDPNLGIVGTTLADGVSHQDIEAEMLELIRNLDTKTITPLVQKVKAGLVTDELFDRSSSLGICQELTEYVASGDWTGYAEAIELTKSITPKDVVTQAQTLFTENNLTIGYFIGN